MKNPSEVSREELEQFILAILPEPPEFDFLLKHRGNLFAIWPLSLPAQRYADQFFPRDPSLWIDGALEFASTEIVDVVRGIQESKLTVGGAA